VLNVRSLDRGYGKAQGMGIFPASQETVPAELGDKAVSDFKMTPAPDLMTDTGVHQLWGDLPELAGIERVIRARIDPSISVAALARALASEGLCMKTLPKSLDFYITRAPGEDWHLDIGEHGESVGKCPVCKSENVQSARTKMVCLDCGHSGVARS
jgi:hypothetical protein